MRTTRPVVWLWALSAYTSLTPVKAAEKAEHSLTIPATHKVSAHEADLSATLSAAGWELRDAVCLDRRQPHLVGGVTRAPDMVWGRRDAQTNAVQDVYVWRNPEMWHGMPQWTLAAADSDESEAWASENLYQAVTDDLLSGIARQHSTGGAPWIEIRHPPLDLRRVMLPMSEAACTDPNRCEGRMPVVLPVQEKQLVDTVVWRDNYEDGSKRVALTFDACSTFETGAYNKPVIDALLANHIPATLFVGGHWAEAHRDILQQLASMPQFEIANHSYSHPHMTQLSSTRQRQELLWTQYLIYDAIGSMPRYFRPPYGEIDDLLIRDVADSGLYTVEFDLPAGDADIHVSDARLIEWILRKASGGSIVVMHMNRPGSKTAEVLPEVARQLRARGFILSTVSELLAEQQQGI